MSTILLDTTDLAEAEAALSANFSKMCIQTTSHTSKPMRVERNFVGSLGIDTAEYGCDFTYEMDPPERIFLCRVDSGGLEAGVPRRQSALFRAGEVYAFGAVEGVPHSGSVRPGRYQHLIICRTLLNKVAAGHPGTGAPVRLTGSVPVSRAATRHLCDGIEYVSRVAVESGAAEHPLIAAGLEQYLGTLLVATLPSTALLEPTIEDRRNSTPALLRHAMTFIDENAHTDISLADIATAVHVTPRALQYMFRKHRDCTPMEYVRRVRLHHAHLDLVTGDRAEITVGAVARRWGFAHVGRFAVYYRHNYGQSPHDTLRAA